MYSFRNFPILDRGFENWIVHPKTGRLAVLVKRDIKGDLLAKAASLEKSINEAITLLTTAGKKAEVAILKKEETKFQTLANKLKATTTVAAILKLGTELNNLEIKIEAELKKAVGRGFI